MLTGPAPWLLSELFATPSYQAIGFGSSPSTLANADGKRIVLICGRAVTSNGDYCISTNPNMSSSEGISVTTNNNPVVLTWDQWGPLVQQAWFGVSSGAGTANAGIWTVSVVDWPKDQNAGLILPSQVMEQRYTAQQQQQQRISVRQLMQRLQRLGITAPDWIKQGLRYAEDQPTYQ